MFFIFCGAYTEEVIAVAEHAVVDPVGSRRTDGDHRNIVHEEHDDDEDRQTQPAVGDDLVDLVGGRKLVFLLVFIYAVNYLAYVNIALVGDDRLCVVVVFFLDSLDVVLDMGECRLAEGELLDDLIVALEDLDRVPALLLLGQIVHAGFFDMSYGVLYRAVEGVLRHRLLLLGSLDSCLGRLPDALAL